MHRSFFSNFSITRENENATMLMIKNPKFAEICLLPYLVFHRSPLYFFLCRSDLSETKNDRIIGSSGDKSTIYIYYTVLGVPHPGLSRLIVHRDIIVSDTFFHVLSFVWKYYTEYYTCIKHVVGLKLSFVKKR